MKTNRNAFSAVRSGASSVSTQEIENRGDYQTTYIGDTPVIVLRDMEGDVQVIVNRCAHRGNLVCINREGNTEELTCVYHNWRYDLQGNLKSVAFGKGVGKSGGMPDDFDRDRARPAATEM